MQKTALIVVAAVIVVEISNFLLRFGDRRLVSFTTMKMLDEIASLAKQQGYASWVDYMKDTHGEEYTGTFLNQLYGTLKKHRIRSKPLAALLESLEKLLTVENRTLRQKKS